MTTEDDVGIQAGAVGFRQLLMGLLLAAVAVVSVLVASVSIDNYSNDAAQYWSVIGHLLAGDGLRTSTIYYEVQAQQGLPAIQTVWPPGLPLVVAGVVAVTGLDAITATVLTNAIAHVATAGLITWIVLKLSSIPIAAVVVGLGYAAYVPGWRLALSGVAEPIYLMLIVASLAAVIKAFEDDADAGATWLAVAVACVGMGAWFRYQSIFHIVPLGLLVLYASGRRLPVIQALVRTTLICLPGALLFVVLVVRNWLVAGTLSGGGVSASSNSLSDLVFQSQWVLLNLLGVADWPTKLAALAVLGLGAAWSVLYLREIWSIEGRSILRPAFDMRGAAAFYGIAGGLFTAAVIFGLTLRSNFYTLEARYFLSSAILVLLGLYAMFGRAGPVASGQRVTRSVGMAAGAAVAVLLAAQISHFVSGAGAPSSIALMRQHLNTPFRDGSVASFLRASASVKSPVMSNQSQLLHLALGKPTFGVPEQRLTARVWSPTDIGAVARRMGVRHAVIFKTLPLGAADGSTDYVWQLMGKRQGWLEPLVETDQIVLYRVGLR